MTKFLLRYSNTILVIIHDVLMLTAFVSFMVLFGVYVYDFIREGEYIRNSKAYEAIDSKIQKVSNFTQLLGEEQTQNFLYSNTEFVIAAEVLMRGNSHIVKIGRVTYDENNNFIDEVAIISKDKNNFYYPNSIITAESLKNKVYYSLFADREGFLIDEPFDAWEYSLNMYSAQLLDIWNLEINKITQRHNSFLVYGLELNEISLDKLVDNSYEKVHIHIKLKAKFLYEKLKNALGTDFLYVYWMKGHKYYFDNNAASVLEKIGTKPIDYGQLNMFNYEGVDYVASSHKFNNTSLTVMSPATVYFSYNEIVDYHKILPLMLALFITSLFGYKRFIFFHTSLRNHVHKILKNQQVKGSHSSLDRNIALIGENFSILNRYMPNNFRSLQLVKEEDLRVRRQEICIMFIQFNRSRESSLDQNKLSYWNKHYQEIIPCIIETGGVIDKLMGHVVLAIWLNKPDHALAIDACNTALAIQNKMKDRIDNVNIGINIGTCDIGSYGNNSRSEFSISGSPVNLTSRICKITQTYGVSMLLSEYVVDCLDKAYCTRFVDAVIPPKTRKGFHLYELLSEAIDEEQVAIESKYIRDFTDAFELYQNKHWQQALVVFLKMEKRYPKNGIIKTFIRRIKTESIPEKWNGYWNL